MEREVRRSEDAVFIIMAMEGSERASAIYDTILEAARREAKRLHETGFTPDPPGTGPFFGLAKEMLGLERNDVLEWITQAVKVLAVMQVSAEDTAAGVHTFLSGVVYTPAARSLLSLSLLTKLPEGEK